jgi:hypothetical protein
LEPTTILLLAVIVLGSAYAGYLIGRWSVLTALEDVANRIDPDVDDQGRNIRGGGSAARQQPPPGPATHSETAWTRQPVQRTAKPPPVLAGNIDGQNSNQASPSAGSGSKKPPASAG